MTLGQVPDPNEKKIDARYSGANIGARRQNADDRIRTIGDPVLAVASRRINGRGKRALDLILGATVFVFVLPLIVSLIIALRLDGGGRAIIRDPRIGRRGRPFTQFSFRLGRPRAHAARGPLGRFLARTRLFKLPSLVNVLIGDLSLIGAPPVDRDGLERFGPARRYYLVARPGLACPWDHDSAKPASVPSLCRDYVLNWRLRHDLAVMGAVLLDGSRQQLRTRA